MYTGVVVRKTLCEIFRYALLIFSALIILGIPGLVIQRLQVYGIPYSYMPHLIFYILPECTQFLLPISLMIGTIITFGRMGAENEITALKSMGIQPVKLVYPLIGVCTLISFGAWYINDISAISRELGIRNLLLSSADEIVNGMLKADGEIKRSDIYIKAESIENDTLHNVSLRYWGSNLSLNIGAKEARLSFDRQRRELIVEMTSGTFSNGNTAKGSFQSKETIRLPIDSILMGDSSASITNATMPQMSKALKALREEIKKLEEVIAVDSAVTLLTGEYSQYFHSDPSYYRARLQENKDLLQKTLIEPYRRFTLGFTCLCLVIIAAPLAIYNSHYDVVTNVFISGAPVLVLFAILFSMGLNFGKQGLLPPWSICLGNVFLVLVGLFLIGKVANE